MRTLLSAFVFVAIGMHGEAWGQSAPGSDIAPGGKLRAGMIAIRVLGGVAEPVGKFIAARLGPLSARHVPQSRSLRAERWQG